MMEGKKSIVLRVKIENDDSIVTLEQITDETNSIIEALGKQCSAEL